jgi:DNA-binding NarL/FixJ family response regulator
MSEAGSLLAIVELGGYPNFIPLYQRLGFSVTVLNSQRKARNYLKKNHPDVIVCEYNFQSDFRDRTSNLETLMAVLQKYPDIRLVVFYQSEHESKFAQVRDRFQIYAALTFPVDPIELEEVLISSLG